jgi:hypothetical protein
MLEDFQVAIDILLGVTELEAVDAVRMDQDFMDRLPGLSIVPSARLLYAATHGRSAWLLQLQ